jgi:hypothetical protein
LLRRSLADQLVRAYLKATGKDKGLKDYQLAIAVRVATSVLGERIDAMLTEALLDLLDKGGTAVYGQDGLSGALRLSTPNFRNLFRFLDNTERFGRDFSIVVPLSADDKTGYRIHLRLEDWAWKLSGLGLPATVQDSIVVEIINSQR